MGGSGNHLMAVLANFRLHEIERELARQGHGDPMQTLREQAAALIRAGGNLTREQTAAHLGVTTRHLSRLEHAGRITRCPQLGRAVMYASRDVLRVTSATRKER